MDAILCHAPELKLRKKLFSRKTSFLLFFCLIFIRLRLHTRSFTILLASRNNTTA